jgi:hypothetical protein
MQAGREMKNPTRAIFLPVLHEKAHKKQFGLNFIPQYTHF